MRRGTCARLVVAATWTLLASAAALSAQTPDCPFARGFNLGGWFQGSSAREISNTYTITDLENMMAMGADLVRVPIDLHTMSGTGPSYTIHPILFLVLDQLVDWCEQLGMYVILDNHTHLTLDADPEKEVRTVAVWRQMAEHFKDRSELVLYEILNEPVGLPTWEWGRIQQKAIDAIRAVDTVHTIIVSPAEMGSYNVLNDLPWYKDDNLIYTFHFYDPFLFTHQGTNWTDPSMASLGGVPYPYVASRMPAMPRSFSGTWLEQQYKWYHDAGNAASVANQISIPIRFGAQRRAPIFCGEFGVWQSGSDSAERAEWYKDVRTLLEANGIPWAMWGYKGGFGIYRENSAGAFPNDLDTAVVRALGLKVPGPLAIEHDTAGWVIYDDLVSQYLSDGGRHGTLDLYDSVEPAEGAYCVRWTGAQQYGAITWRFTNPRDLSLLAAEGYLVRLWVKTDAPGMRFDLRFVDTDTGTQDHPWRMAKTIDSGLATMDGEWHQVAFALSDMIDVGAFDDNTWHRSEGKFDWTRIDRFEIVAEHQAIEGKHLWLDAIEIVAPPVLAASTSASARVPDDGSLLANGDFSS